MKLLAGILGLLGLAVPNVGDDGAFWLFGAYIEEGDLDFFSKLPLGVLLPLSAAILALGAILALFIAIKGKDGSLVKLLSAILMLAGSIIFFIAGSQTEILRFFPIAIGAGLGMLGGVLELLLVVLKRKSA